MRLVSYPGGFGRVEGDLVVPMGDDLLLYLRDGRQAPDGTPVPLAALELLAPVPHPGKVVCVGLNYRDHAAEVGKDVPTEPVLFGKWANSVTGPDVDVEIPPGCEKVDYEGELGVVIGTTARRVSVEDAMDHVAGYVVCNDLSARDLQWRLGQWTRGKAIDGFLPMGPALVTADEVGDPGDLPVRTWLNGELVQDSSTAQLVFGVAELVSSISGTITLEPGDVIATGTPPGVGMAHDPPRFLQPGDEVAVEVGRVGRITTRMVAPRD